MSIFSSGSSSSPIRRLNQADHLQNEDDREEKRKRRVVYQGREWAEGEQELPVQPQAPDLYEKKEKKHKRSLFMEPLALEQAKEWFLQLSTLEDKIAQLCFLQVVATYDLEASKQVEAWLRQWRIGGLLFTGGEYRREAYLIEHYNSLSSLPLLMGNDFIHGLSLYFEGPIPPSLWDPATTERRFLDLGKALANQNRRLGIHLQIDSPSLQNALSIQFKEEWRKSFRRGIRDAAGIVGRRLKGSQSSVELTQEYSLQPKKEMIHTKTLFLWDIKENFLTSDLLQGQEGNALDGILVGENFPSFLAALTQTVRSGAIPEAEIDKRVMKILLMKALQFPALPLRT